MAALTVVGVSVVILKAGFTKGNHASKINTPVEPITTDSKMEYAITVPEPHLESVSTVISGFPYSYPSDNNIVGMHFIEQLGAWYVFQNSKSNYSLSNEYDSYASDMSLRMDMEEADAIKLSPEKGEFNTAILGVGNSIFYIGRAPSNGEDNKGTLYMYDTDTKETQTFWLEGYTDSYLRSETYSFLAYDGYFVYVVQQDKKGNHLWIVDFEGGFSVYQELNTEESLRINDGGVVAQDQKLYMNAHPEGTDVYRIISYDTVTKSWQWEPKFGELTINDAYIRMTAIEGGILYSNDEGLFYCDKILNSGKFLLNASEFCAFKEDGGYVYYTDQEDRFSLCRINIVTGKKQQIPTEVFKTNYYTAREEQDREPEIEDYLSGISKGSITLSTEIKVNGSWVFGFECFFITDDKISGRICFVDGNYVREDVDYNFINVN